MGRPRKLAGQGLPLRVYIRSGAFYYVHAVGGRWEHIGSDLEAAKAQAAVYNGNAPLRGTMAHWLDEWKLYLDKRVAKQLMSGDTVLGYAKDSVLLKEFFGSMLPASVEARHVTEYLDLGVDLDRPVRANREKAALSSCMGWMAARGHGGLTGNVCLLVPRNPETPRTRYITDDEYNTVFKLASAPVRAWMVLIYRTLQRPEDVLSWTRRNIVDKDSRRVLEFTQSKTKRPMSIFMNADIEEALQEVRAARSVDGLPLITTQDGQRYTAAGLSSMFRRHVKDSGIKNYALYDHKAKGATDMYKAGTPIEIISALCGHMSIKTTEIYIKAHTRETVDANSRVIPPTVSKTA